jgi:hypothetical protein
MTPIQQNRPTADRRDELERIKAATWPPDEPEEVRNERIRQAVEAIQSLTPWNFPVPLDSKTWKFIAESPEVYDED